ncbi:hypothetical protein Salat_0265000 [Sesamum alatum]|uniref:Uncharacterized protein n=1 Tax=Sesamum alatum TaxID=300844 RepID=A0AAE1YZP4_9LAMI|nr:hypothetical protein Salat_0265000 [Sesamum alatum]
MGFVSSKSSIPSPRPGERALKRHHSALYYATASKESLTPDLQAHLRHLSSPSFPCRTHTFVLCSVYVPTAPDFPGSRNSPSPCILSKKTGYLNPKIIYNANRRNANQTLKPKNTTIIAGQLGGAALTVTQERWHSSWRTHLARDRWFFPASDYVNHSVFKISSWDSKRHKMRANCPVGSRSRMVSVYANLQRTRDWYFTYSSV